MKITSRLIEQPGLQVSIGSHSSAAEGTCLMELASVIADEEFSASPRCVHPSLAALARLVNDHVSYPTRQSLVLLLPEMMTYSAPDARLDWAINVSCLTSTCELKPTRRGRRQLRRAQRRLSRLQTERASRLEWLRRPYRRLVGGCVVFQAAWVASRHGEERLVALLADAVAAYSWTLPAIIAEVTLPEPEGIAPAEPAEPVLV